MPTGDAGELQSVVKKTYGTLDALRGAAAITVVTGHASALFGIYTFKSAYLAVDLFFCLSGFVIAHAYGARLERGFSVLSFMRVRLVRLYPLFALTIPFSLAVIVVAWLFGNGTLRSAWSAPFSILFLPDPFSDSLYPINLPAWSLFFELLVNLAAVLLWRRLTGSVLLGIVLAGAAALVVHTARGADLNGGFTWATFYVGLFRVTYSFFVGVLLYRLDLRRLPRLGSAILVIAALLMLGFARTFGAIGELASILVLTPVLVALASVSEPRWPALCAVSGRLSYAVYVIHYPALAAYTMLLTRVEIPAPASGALFLAAIIAASWLADRYFDAPVRRLITRKLKRA